MTYRRAHAMILAILLAVPSLAVGQTRKPAPPATPDAVGPFDAAIVARAETLLSSPQHWNRIDKGSCPRADTTYSIRCALNRAEVEGVGLLWNSNSSAPASTMPAAPVECSMDVSPGHRGGSCRTLWDEIPVFMLSRAKAVTSGIWRRDAQPTEVWAGTMSDAEGPVNYESRAEVPARTTPSSSDPRIDFNNDSATRFDDVQAYFRALAERVRLNGAADLKRTPDGVEIEIYGGSKGVIRTYNGWFPVSGFSVHGSTVHFQFDTTQEIAPNAVDREILVRASQILSSDSVWNRADNRQCPATATKWSIYCAVERAQIEVAGGFHHRRPAGELVREIVEGRTKARHYHHRMMDYNNDPTTTLADVQSVFAEAIARIKP